MSAVEILLGAVEPVGLRLRQGSSLQTGATVRARVLRASDGKELDWSTSTFVSSGSAVQPRQTLTETPALSGLYEYAWDTSTITNPTTPDTYLVEYDQTAPVARSFIRQSEIRVRATQAVSSAVAAVPTNIWGFSPRTLTAGAITSSTFSTDAIDSNAVAPSAVSEVATGVWVSGTRTITGTAAGAISSSSFSTDAVDANALASSAAAEVAGKVWDELVASHAVAGSFGLLVGTDLDASVSSRATNAGVWSTAVPGAFLAGSAGYVLGTYLDRAVSIAEGNIRGVQSLDLSLIGGSGFNTSLNSLVQVTNDLDSISSTIADLQNNTAFTAVVPELGVPLTGTTAYEIRVLLEDSNGMPVDPDANTINVAVENGANVDRSGNLSSPTMTRIGVGRYEVFYTVAFDAAIEQLIFEFTYSIGGSPFARDRTTNVTNGANVFTVADRATLDAVLADTTAVKGSDFVSGTDSLHALRARGDAAWTTAFGFSVPGDAMTLTSGERSSVALRLWSETLPGTYGAGQAGFYLDAQVTSRATNAGASAAVWSAPTRTLTSVILDAGSLTAATIGTGYVAAVQAGLSTSAQIPGLVWDELLASHTTPGSAGQILFEIDLAASPTAIAAAVWATPEGAGTMGASLALVRRRTTNRRRLTADGTITFYDDAGLPEKTALLTDVNAGPIVVVPGDPADSSKET